MVAVIFKLLGYILGGLFILINRKVLFNSLFLEPIRGGNGVTQMDELAKYILIILAVIVTLSNLQSVTVLYAILGAITTIAGLKMWLGGKGHEDEKTDN